MSGTDHKTKEFRVGEGIQSFHGREKDKRPEWGAVMRNAQGLEDFP